MKNAIVITTINEPTEAIFKFSNLSDWHLFIVGDLKTPENLYSNINCTYLTPDYQTKKYPNISDEIGWNTSIRRNIGFIEAYRSGVEIIALSDDDNIPLDNWGKDLTLGKEIEVDYYKTSNRIFDPMQATNYPYLWHRGYPIHEVALRRIDKIERIKIKPLIQVDLWNGDPDIDALERLIFKPEVELKIKDRFCSNTISPFDSQNTFIHRNMMKYFMLVSEIGRVDDIWGSYMLQQKYRQDLPYIVYSYPSVYQKRNIHDLLQDFKSESYSYLNFDKFFNGTLDIYPRIQKLYNLYQSYF